ncbi:MAG: type II secretion system F family protein [Actinomycetota bacterium]
MAQTFAYRVRDRSGNVVSGTAEGESQAVVASRLRQQGLTPLEITEGRAGGLRRDVAIPGLSKLGKRIKLKDVAILSRQFATMIGSGLSILRALNILTEQTQNAELARIVGEVRTDVETGSSLSLALSRHPKAFNKLYVAMVRAGETGGVLDSVLLRVADTLEKQVALRQKIRSAMTYPVVVAVFVTLILIAMLVFVVPMFKELYSELGGILPLPTRILLSVSSIVAKFWYIVLGLVIAAAYALRRYIATEKGRYQFDVFLLRVPVFGPLFHKVALARFSRTLAVLMRSGVPILQALEIVSETVGNEVIGRAILDVQQSVKEGEAISKPLLRHKVFPPMVVQMMAVGEETGALDTMLEKIADFYDQEVESTVAALTSLIEPILIAVMGATVGGMVIALYMPMFNIINLIK